MQVELQDLKTGQVRPYEVIEVTLTKRTACCGLDAVWECIPLGKKYQVIPETRKTGILFCAGCQKPIESILARDADGMWCPLPTIIFDGLDLQ